MRTIICMHELSYSYENIILLKKSFWVKQELTHSFNIPWSWWRANNSFWNKLSQFAFFAQAYANEQLLEPATQTISSHLELDQVGQRGLPSNLFKEVKCPLLGPTNKLTHTHHSLAMSHTLSLTFFLGL